jgi:beta-glucanase (GH16 family)
MNRALVSWLAALLLLAGCGQARTPAADLTPSASPATGYQLVWSDEFDVPDGSAPDPGKWNHSTGGSGWGNGELEYYTDSVNNAYVSAGMLVIQTRQESMMGRDYTSARLNTMVYGQWTYGRFEIRARLPDTQGIWPAFWLLPALARYGSWPAGGEIDIMELIGSEPGRVYGTLHYGNPHQSIGGHYDLSAGQVFADDFHVFALEWEPSQIRWYVDGALYQTADEWFTSKPNAPFPAPFDQPFYLILNVAVGGNWPGSPDSTSVFPQSMHVDYVRVYQEVR